MHHLTKYLIQRNTAGIVETTLHANQHQMIQDLSQNLSTNLLFALLSINKEGEKTELYTSFYLRAIKYNMLSLFDII